MTRQTKLAASGDLTQRVEFMGDFSQSFNAMVIQLDQAIKEITKKDVELNQINEEMIKGIAIRKKAEAALKRVNEDLVKGGTVRKEAETAMNKINGELAKEIDIRKEAEAALSRANKDLAKEITLRKEAEAALRQSQEAFRVLSITDPLTGLYNRRQFNHLAEVEIRRTLRYGRPLAAMMLDIDFFKHINDTFGHTCGDMVLKLVAKTTKEMLRSNDIPARYGVEEFVVLFPETPVEAAANIAERLRRRIKESTIETEKGPITVTASFGVSEFLGKSTSKPSGKILSDFISKADQALNTSKNAGRNRVTVYKPAEEGLD
jgi:diguanylate cyclase (GGDEF)-like protein